MKTITIRNGNERTEINFGLRYIKGNSAPYFSITCVISELRGSRWVHDGGGCAHQHILSLRPDLADIVALHLSDVNGVPMHCIANGLYYLTPACADHMRADFDGVTVASNHFRMPVEWVKHLDTLETKDERTAMVKTLKDMYKQQADALIAKYELEIPEYPVDDYVNPLD